MTEFEQFWTRYPRKVGRLVAEQKFKAARKQATLEDILAGVDRYVASKPEYADWCHPKTWLSQGRWMDEPDRRSGVDRRQSRECEHSPRCPNPGNWQCQQRTVLEAARAKAS